MEREKKQRKDFAKYQKDEHMRNMDRFEKLKEVR